MSIAKFKVVIRLEKTSKSKNEAPICLRITKDRKTTYKTITHIDPKYWDDKNQQVKKQHPNAAIFNMQIASKRAELEKEVMLLATTSDNVGIATIRNKINNTTSFDLFEYADKFMSKLFEKGNYATYKKYKSVIKKLREYIKADKLPISTITPELISSYEHYLLNVVGNNHNTITVNMKSIAKLVNDIFTCYDLEQTTNPFKKIKFKKEETNREFLSMEEVKKIVDFNCKPWSPLYDARQVFLFECASGIRISDILTLKWRNVKNDTIEIRMRKTNKPHIMPQHQYVKDILETRRNIVLKDNRDVDPNSYVFNILKRDIDIENEVDMLNAISCATAIINKQLKTLAQKVGIDKRLSTHVGRHTFASLLANSNVNPFVLQELMGHSDVRVTQVYINIMAKTKNDAINSINF